MLITCGWPLAARAQGAPQPRTVHAIDAYPYYLRNETWGGADVASRQWSIYSGATRALSGDIEQPGWRLRSTEGYGSYTYRKWQHGPDRRRRERINVRYTGQKYFSNVLLGYQFQWHRLTLKAFGGLAAERHTITPRDTGKAMPALSYGAKAALDAWFTFSERQWLATHVSFASNVNSYKFSVQTGRAIWDDLDLGIEAHLDGKSSYRSGRIGGFATWRLGDAGLSLATGASVDRDRHAAAYASVNLFVRY